MDTPSRPHWRPPYRFPDYLAEILAALGLLACIAFSLTVYPRLPAIIPIHFDLNGTPNNYGSRMWIFFPPAVALGLYLLLTIISRYPWIFNYPWRVTPANAPRLYRVARSLLLWLKVEIIVIFDYTALMIYRYATIRPAPLDFWFIPALLTIIFSTVALAIYRMRPSTWETD